VERIKEDGWRNEGKVSERIGRSGGWGRGNWVRVNREADEGGGG